jgi:CBS domain-containing protein
VNASGVTTTKVITAKSEQTMQEVAELLLVNHITGMPVVDQSGKLVGMISEGTCSDVPMRVCGRKPGGHHLVGVG